MDSLPLLPSNCDPRFSGASFTATRRRGSTSQMCLQRILTTIATVPPPLSAAKPSFMVPETEKSNGAGDDAVCLSKCSSRSELNSMEAKESLSSSSGGGGEGLDVVDRDDGGDRAERSLTLLIEAAKLILGEFVGGDESEAKERCGLELKREDVAAGIGGAFEEAPPPPVVRSKRGRTRVLPCRYRDSAVEPLTRFSRTGSSVTPAKRRRR